MTLRGNFRQHPLPDLLRFIEGQQRSGRLAVGLGSPLAHVYFSMGQWVAHERIGLRVTLAQQLDRAGILPAARLEAALGASFDRTDSMLDSQLARTLINAGALSDEQMRDFMFHDALNVLATMLQWPDGEFYFEDGVPFPPGALTCAMRVSDLLAQTHSTLRPLAADAPPLAPEMIISFAEVSARSEAPIQITRDQWRLLTLVDGDAPLWAIAQHLQAPEPVILRLAGELVALNLAVIVGRAAPPVGG